MQCGPRLGQLSEFEKSYTHVFLYPPQPTEMLTIEGRRRNLSTRMYGIYLKEVWSRSERGYPISHPAPMPHTSCLLPPPSVRPPVTHLSAPTSLDPLPLSLLPPLSSFLLHPSFFLPPSPFLIVAVICRYGRGEIARGRLTE